MVNKKVLQIKWNVEKVQYAKFYNVQQKIKAANNKFNELYYLNVGGMRASSKIKIKIIGFHYFKIDKLHKIDDVHFAMLQLFIIEEAKKVVNNNT